MRVRARQEERRRQEADRLARERQQQKRLEEERKRGEAARREQQRLEAEERSRQQRAALVRAEFLESADYATILRQSDRIVQGLKVDLITEGSAYRSIGGRTRAA